MTVEVALVISGLSFICSAIFGVSAMKRGNRESTQRDTTQLTTVIVKLESIGEGVSEIKSELRNVKRDVQELRERLAKVEASSASAHKRMDTFEKKGDKYHEE